MAGVSFGQDNQMLPGEVVSRSESVGEATEQLQKAAPDQVEQIEVPAAVQAVQVLQRVYRGHLGRNEARDVLFDLMEAAEAEELEQRYYEDDEIMPMKDEVEPAPAAAVGSGDPRMHRRRSSQAMLVASQRAVDEVLASPLAIAESDAQRRQQEQQRKHSGLSSPFSSSPFASSPMTSSPIASSPLEKCRQVRRQSSRLELLAVQNAVSDALASPIAASLNAKSDLEQCAALCEEARRAMAAGDFEHALDLYEDAAAIETVAQHHLKRMLGVMHVAFTPDVSDEQQGRSIELGQKAQRALDDGMNRSAIIMFSKAIQLDPLEVDAFVGRATAHLREGSFSDAAIDASVALVLDPDDARAAQIEAEATQELDRIAKEEAAAAEAAAARRRAEEAERQRAKEAAEDAQRWPFGRLESVRAEMTASMRRGSMLVMGLGLEGGDVERCAELCSRARGALDQDRVEKAMRFYEMAVECDTPARFHITRLLAVLRVAYAREVTGEEQERCEQFCAQAAGKLGQGDVEGAILLYSEAIENDPLEIEAFLGRAAAHIRDRNYHDGSLDAAVCTAMDPKDARAYSLDGAARLGLGRAEEAMECFRAGLHIDPRNKFMRAAKAKLRAMRLVAVTPVEEEDSEASGDEADASAHAAAAQAAQEAGDEDDAPDEQLQEHAAADENAAPVVEVEDELTVRLRAVMLAVPEDARAAMRLQAAVRARLAAEIVRFWRRWKRQAERKKHAGEEATVAYWWKERSDVLAATRRLQAAAKMRLLRILYTTGSLWVAASQGVEGHASLQEMLIDLLLVDGGLLHRPGRKPPPPISTRSLPATAEEPDAMAALSQTSPEGFEKQRLAGGQALDSSVEVQGGRLSPFAVALSPVEGQPAHRMHFDADDDKGGALDPQDGQAGAVRAAKASERTSPHSTVMRSGRAVGQAGKSEEALERTGMGGGWRTRKPAGGQAAKRGDGRGGAGRRTVQALSWVVSAAVEAPRPPKKVKPVAGAMVELVAIRRLQAQMRAARTHELYHEVMDEIVSQYKATVRLQVWWWGIWSRRLGRVVDAAVYRERRRQWAALRIQTRMARGPAARRVARLLHLCRVHNLSAEEREWEEEKYRRGIYTSPGLWTRYQFPAEELQAVARRAVMSRKYKRYQKRRKQMTKQERAWEELRLSRVMHAGAWRDARPSDWKHSRGRVPTQARSKGRTTTGESMASRAGGDSSRMMGGGHEEHWWFKFEEQSRETVADRVMASAERLRLPSPAPVALPRIDQRSYKRAKRPPPRGGKSTRGVTSGVLGAYGASDRRALIGGRVKERLFAGGVPARTSSKGGLPALPVRRGVVVADSTGTEGHEFALVTEGGALRASAANIAKEIEDMMRQARRGRA